MLSLKQLLLTAATIICSLEDTSLVGVRYLHILSQPYKSYFSGLPNCLIQWNRGKRRGREERKGECSQQDNSMKPLEVLWGWILAHSPMLVSTTSFNCIRWNIIIRLYPCFSLHYVCELSLVFILVKGKDAVFNNPNWHSQLKQCISWQHMH